MTANIRSMNGKNSNLNYPTSKFFARSQSSDDDCSSVEESSSIRNSKNLDDGYDEEEFSSNSRSFINTGESFVTDSVFKNESPVFDEFKDFDDEEFVAKKPLKLAKRHINSIEENKRRQGRLLFVSLLENFCLLYDSNPERNHKLFYIICKTLSAMGIVGKEYIDEMSTVRSSYQNAFKALVVQALNSIKQEQKMFESHMIMPSNQENSEKTCVDKNKTESKTENKDDQEMNPISIYQNLRKLSFADILDLENSRYNNDFIEIKLLGKGGFASVWKAKNKLDGIEYAIKKVRLRGNRIPGSKGKIFREIKSLARLEHTNVVRYYSSWLEYHRFNHESNDLSENSSESSEHYNSNPNFTESDDDSDIFRMSFSDEEIDYSGVDFVGSDDVSNVNNELNSESNSELTSELSITKKNNDSYNNNLKKRLKFDNKKYKKFNKDDDEELHPESDWMLFIQMQLCHASLLDYMKLRDAHLLTTKKDPLNALDRHASIELFRGIVRGVAYIHEQGLIHRDLKPGNIFVGIIPESGQGHEGWVTTDFSSYSVDRLVPKIGDFGLVTAVDENHMESPIDEYHSFHFGSAPGENSNNKHLNININNHRPSSSFSYSSKPRTTGVGTVTYASPEQLANPTKIYNEKADIYSLGIIFFELHFPFSTGHERVQVLKDLRHGILPNGFAAFILWMMAENTEQRPDAKQILEFELLAGPIHGEDAEIQHRLVESTQRIDSMKKENEILKKKIVDLEEKLKKCECNGGKKEKKNGFKLFEKGG
ncbi:5495_t:CDS:10 [Diversispora eburnea]|uniref:non-specific serine/threonine protein kinase n=1 Tax=Diversispora eburnea TaxID=1213867 RepID=A0A9N8ZR52_9GLOM|nr:5495_t:CDS:10 [Diversispora eburnea]